MNANHHRMASLIGKLSAPKRNNYFYGMLLSEEHFRQEQSYFNNKRWLLNRLGLGSGVLCGLDALTHNGELCITPGVAIDALGREIIVPELACLDPWKTTDSCGVLAGELDRDQPHTVTICISYHECGTDYAPTLVSDCNASEGCEPGSILESYHLLVNEGTPPEVEGLDPELCQQLGGGQTGGSTTGGYQVIATVNVGGEPFGAAAGPQRVVVIARGNTAPVHILDASTNQELHTLSNLPGQPNGVCIAADGGPAFVTHEHGVSVIDYTAEPPAIITAFLSVKNYTACVAKDGGKTLFAIDANAKAVDRIDVASQTVVTSFGTGSGPDDLALSPDGQFLYVTDRLDNMVSRIDLASASVDQKTPTGPPSQTVAVRATASGPEAWIARTGSLRRIDAGGNTSDQAISADGRDSAFTSDSSRYYLVNANPDTGEHELVIYQAEGLAEIARLTVGLRPAAVAIVPNRLRAFVANRDSGTVSVVDVETIDRRTLLCRNAGPCPEIEGDPCVALCVVQLLPGGMIGEVDCCSYRRVIYSNAMLLDLILCLFERLEECCTGPAPTPTPTPTPTFEPTPTPTPTPEPTPTPTPTPTVPPTPTPTPPPPVRPIKIRAIEFRDANNNVVEKLTDPSQRPAIKVSLNTTTIRVTFNKAVDHGTITAGDFAGNPPEFSFLVQASWSNRPDNFVPGKIIPESPQVTRFQIHEEFGILRQGEYKVTLFGEKDPNGLRPAITGMDGTRLDGEPLGLPSGDNVEGGDFGFEFAVV